MMKGYKNNLLDDVLQSISEESFPYYVAQNLCSNDNNLLPCFHNSSHLMTLAFVFICARWVE